MEAWASFGHRSDWRDHRTVRVLEQDTVFVAEVGGAIAGFVALQHDPPSIEIEELLVTAGHEHEDVGSQLLAYAEGWAISNGATTLRVIAERDNHSARSLYLLHGFAPCGDELLERSLPNRAP
jgi:GNAT superfamily N-acetyltransferase